MAVPRVASIVIVTLCLAAPARAQITMKVDRHVSIADVGAGGFLQGPLDEHQSSGQAGPGFGVALLGTIYPTEVVGLAGELAGYADSTSHGHTALFGPKVRTRLIRNGKTNWRLFGQVLGGTQSAPASAGRHVIQPGVGAEDYLGNGLTLHVQYDYTFPPGSFWDRSTGRFLVGVALPLGER